MSKDIVKHRTHSNMYMQREGGKDEEEILLTLKRNILQYMTIRAELENTAVVKMI